MLMAPYIHRTISFLQASWLPRRRQVWFLISTSPSYLPRDASRTPPQSCSSAWHTRRNFLLKIRSRFSHLIMELIGKIEKSVRNCTESKDMIPVLRTEVTNNALPSSTSKTSSDSFKCMLLLHLTPIFSSVKIFLFNKTYEKCKLWVNA